MVKIQQVHAPELLAFPVILSLIVFNQQQPANFHIHIPEFAELNSTISHRAQCSFKLGGYRELQRPKHLSADM